MSLLWFRRINLTVSVAARTASSWCLASLSAVLTSRLCIKAGHESRDKWRHSRCGASRLGGVLTAVLGPL